MYAAMHGGYDYMRSEVLPKRLMPSKRTLQRQLSKVACEAGIATDFLKLLAVKAESMNEEDKCCILNIDEMAIKPAYVYDLATQSYCGTITVPLGQGTIAKRIKENGEYEEEKELACHAMSIILVGLSKAWKQFIAFQFTGYSFDSEFVAKWLIDVIKKTFEAGLYIKGVTMDNSTQNTNV